MGVSEAIRRTEEEIAAVTHLKLSGVIGAIKKDDGWHISVEMVERHALPDSQYLGNLRGCHRRDGRANEL